MEKRILVAFLLSMAVLYGSRFVFSPKPAAESTSQTGDVQQSPAPLIPEQKEIQVERLESRRRDVVQASAVEETVVETPLYRAALSNHGAVLKSFKLTKYKDETNQPTELIDSRGAEKVGWPLAVTTGDPKLDEVIAGANFVVTRDGPKITMDYANSGIHVRKTVVFDTENYLFSVVTDVARDEKPVAHMLVWQSAFGDQSIPDLPAKRFVVYPNGTSYKRTAIPSLKDPQEMSVNRLGVQDQYFLAMFLLPENATSKIRKVDYTTDIDGKTATVPSAQIAVPATEQPVRVYVGPMEPKALSQADPQLATVIDYGFFGVIAKPLTTALLWTQSFVGNFGWSIILLTVLINLALFPLRIKQQISMQKMQKIQPQMRTLQDRYKKLKPTDPKRAEVQSQMMNLYKEHGINPMSGCLPLLLQMPFLIAFYTMLSVAIELRHAPWILWIQDLSKSDPYHVMPLTMAGSMIVQQKMTPTTVDPAQAKMMMLMPLMLTALFWSAQSGLMLYWLTSNVVGIATQYLMNKYWGPTDPSPARKKNNSSE